MFGILAQRASAFIKQLTNGVLDLGDLEMFGRHPGGKKLPAVMCY